MKPKLAVLSILISIILLAGCNAATSTAVVQPSDIPLSEATITAVVVPATAMATLPATEALAAPSQTVAVTPTFIPYEELIPQAEAFIEQLNTGEYAAGFAQFDDDMKEALPEDKVKEMWEQITTQVGAYQGQLSVRTETKDIYQAVILTGQFEKANLDIRVVFNPQGKIAGLFFTQAETTPQSFEPPPYADQATFTEQEVTIGSGEWAVPGTLSLPNGEGPFPAVVLVHGSGPNDRDETIGANKPFRDLAWGLASRGIAVLRYEKRTRAHASQFTGDVLANLTLQEETIDDALLAAELLRQTDGIDPQQVFVLGHSLGAMAAPRIGEQDPSLAGLILLAGPARPLEDVVLDQINYLFEQQGSPAEGQADVDAIATQVALVKDPNLSNSTPAADLPLGIHPAYWLDLRGYDPVAVAQGLRLPLLVLQGGRDYQVLADKDFGRWQKGLEGKPNASLKLYPDLNHQFMTGEGMSTPDEYNQPGHVSQEVVEDIAAWIVSQAPQP